MNILKRYFLIITLLKETHLTKQLKVNFKISAQFVKACREKCRKWMDGESDGSRVTTLKLNMQNIKTKTYAKFQLNMSKHVGEKCGKLIDGEPDGQTDRGSDITIP